MPFVQRKSNPVRISRGVQLDKDVIIPDELECITNHTLCGVIQQLSTLNHHAADMFNELCNEASSLHQKTNNLRNKVNEMKERYKKWSKKKLGGLVTDDIEDEKPLPKRFDQQILGPDSRPQSIKWMYDAAFSPPAIAKTDQFRENGKQGLKLYTDPTFFIMDWTSQMMKKESEQKERHKRHREKGKEKRGNGPRKVIRTQDLMQEKAKGKEFTPDFVPETNNKKRKKPKKPKMEGFSSKQWANQHPDEKHGNKMTIPEYNPGVENEEPTPKTQTEDEAGEPPPVPRRNRASTENKYSDLPPPPPDPNKTFGDLPPPPPDPNRYRDLPPPPPDPTNRHADLPPPPPDPPEIITLNGPRQSTAFPPAPHNFYQHKTMSVAPDFRSSFFPPPPPLLIDDDDTQGEFLSNRSSFMLPPPPLDFEPPVKYEKRSAKDNRTSTFILPPVWENDRMSSSNFPDIAEIQEEGQESFPSAPPPPPAPSLPSIASAEIASNTPEPTSKGSIFTRNALLSMKQKLTNARDRVVEPVISAKSNTNNFDVHSIMAKALESHRKVKADSSSEDESVYSDSDSDWE